MLESWTRRARERLEIRTVTGLLGTVGAVLLVFSPAWWMFWTGVVVLVIAVVLGFLDGYRGLSQR